MDQPPALPNDLMTVTELAKELGLSPRTVRTAARNGGIPGFQLKSRGKWRFRRCDVVALMTPTAVGE